MADRFTSLAPHDRPPWSKFYSTHIMLTIREFLAQFYERNIGNQEITSHIHGQIYFCVHTRIVQVYFMNNQELTSHVQVL